MLETSGHTRENLSNLDFFLLMILNKYLYFCAIKVSGHMLEISEHTPETCTNLEIFKHMP